MFNVMLLFFSLTDKNIEIGDIKKMTYHLLSNFEEKIQELKIYCYRLANRRLSKRRGCKKKPIISIYKKDL